MKSIIPVIEANYANMTVVERTIADYFISRRELPDMAAKAVAGEISVSEAGLSRFAQKCGFKGYREFAYAYRQTFEGSRLATESDKHTMLVLESYQELLDKVYTLMDEDQVHRIVDMIMHSRRIFALGKGHSGLAAQEMATRFKWIGVDAESNTDGDYIRLQSVFFGEKDLVFGLSISGTTEEIVYALKRAHDQGAKTVFITAHNDSDYAAFCDEVALVPSLEYLNQGNFISPQFPLLMMADIIYSDYVNRNERRVKPIQTEIQRTLKE